MITSEAMLDPAVSLGMLRLDTQLALAGLFRRATFALVLHSSYDLSADMAFGQSG